MGSSVKGKLTKNAYYLLIFVPAKPKVPALPAGKPGAPAPPADEEDEQHAMALYVPVHTFKDGCHLQLFDPNIGILRVHFEHNGERLISEVFDSYRDDDGKSSPFDRWKLFRVMRK